MEKTKTFSITKDFGSKTLSKVFVREIESETVYISLKEKISDSVKNTETVCVVAENPINNELMEIFCSVREKLGIRIYVIVPKLNDIDFARLKNNCIVREVPNIKGNYLICDSKEAFFYDENLNGYCLCNTDTVEKLRDFFIYQFWNNASKEYISQIKDVADQTFDVAPVLESKEVIISLNNLLDNADSFCMSKTLSEFMKQKSYNAALYLSKNVIEKNRDWLLKENGTKIVYTDSLSVPLCKSNDSWYILNDNFAVLLEEEPVFGNCFILRDELTYRDAIGKDILSLKDFSSIIIVASDSENKSIPVDYRTFRQIEHMSENERIKLFEKNSLLQADKLAASIDFSITMIVKKLSKDAKTAPIYSEYNNFNKALADCVEKIEKAEKQDAGKDKSKSLENKKLLEKSKGLPKVFEKLEDCDKAIAIFASLKSLRPSFDKPKSGTLYKTNAGYEYVLNSSDDLEKAEAEMQIAKINDVKFVDSIQ